MPYGDTLFSRATRDDAARVAELRSAAIALAVDVGPSSLAAVRADPNLAVRRRPTYDVSFLGIGAAVEPFGNADVRRAVALGLERGGLVPTVFRGGGRAGAHSVSTRLVRGDETISRISH